MTKDLEVVKKELEQTAPKVVEMAKSLVIKSEDDSKTALSILRDIKTFIRDASEYWKDPVSKSYEAWKALKKKENEMIDPAILAEKEIKAKIGAWDLKQEQARKSLQDAIIAEQKAKADQLLKRAENAESKGNSAKAEALREQSANLEATAVVVPEAEKQQGKSTTYKFTGVIEKTDIIPDQFWMPDQKEIDAYLQRTQGARPIPGVRIVKTPIISVRL